MKCRHCGSALELTMADLGTAPPSNAYLTRKMLNGPETWYPLRVLVCERCWLVQTQDFAGASELFDDQYAYFSGYSSTWLKHVKTYCMEMIQRFNLDHGSHVIELAANDGSLLQYLIDMNIPCTGVEPTESTANAAREKGIPIIQQFFGFDLAKKLARDGVNADLVIANNVLAHVPDINDFVSGIPIVLSSSGVVTFEFPHLVRMMEGRQFDTIYHEHYSYLSLTAVESILSANGLDVFDVQELETHGGSLRVFSQRQDSKQYEPTEAVHRLRTREHEAGILSSDYYGSFQKALYEIKSALLQFLLETRNRGESVIGYGAAAKGNTLLNFSGIRSDLLPAVIDRNPAKQGKYLPGSRIPIIDDGQLSNEAPKYVLILPWNIKAEIMEQLHWMRKSGTRFVTAIPELTIE